jgi:hypothetical protein
MTRAVKLEVLAARIADEVAPLVIERIDEFLRQHGGGELVTTAEAAGILGRKPEWIRDHADELGAVRLTEGPRPRLYFPASELARHRNGG